MQTIEEDLRYPVGKFDPKPFSTAQKEEWLADIRFLPQALESAIHNLDEAQLQTPYRDGGWTAHQVVHHVADSHMNAYCRFKLGVTEEKPTIRPYDENLWAQTADVKRLPINVSLTLLHALHQRWVVLLQHISDEDLQQKTVYHPEHKKELTLWHLLGMYAWHSRHHTAHITTPQWMKILLREETDPFSFSDRAGALNVIDLANLHSCSFIATDDRGRIDAEGRLEILGRLDNSDIRGCSQLAL